MLWTRDRNLLSRHSEMGHHRLVIVVLFLSICSGVVTTSDADDQIIPEWIWGRRTRQPDQDVSLGKSFPVKGAVQSATIHLAADFNRCRLLLNNRLLVELDEYGPWLQRDVTNDLRLGENRLSLECRSGRGPAAIAISLQIVYADGAVETIRSGEDWTSGGDAAVSFGAVAGELWNVENLARISAFDDYEQWRRASGADVGTDPATFKTTAGFEVDLVRSAKPSEGSWVSMAFDPQGRVTIAREDKGLLRMSLSDDGSHVDQVETINDGLLECRGLLYAHDSLYANANNSKGLYRLRDSDGDDEFDDVTLLREFPGSVGHGRNDLALGPDGLIYSIHGDSVQLATENITDHTSPLRAARKGTPSEEGHVIRTDRDGKQWELVSSGLRNPFGIDFNHDGQAFTYDADNEYDMGAPWYRPTRMVQLVSGGDYGWRRTNNGEWPPYYPDHADNALPTVDVGKGSPTAVKSGIRSAFPDHYRRALFALDWAYGRILACHLSPRGAGYACRVETFLAGRPLNVTDLDFGPEGNMYVITGGRKTQSAIYRIRYVGQPIPLPSPTTQLSQREEFSRQSRDLLRKLSDYHREHGAEAVSVAWQHLAHPDPLVRNAARVAIEHQPVQLWAQAAISEVDPELAATALLTLARAGRNGDRNLLLDRLDAQDVGSISALGKLSILHAYRLVLKDAGKVDPEAIESSKHRLLSWLENESAAPVAPLGSGYSVLQELARLVADHHVSGSVRPLIKILKSAENQRDRMNSLYMLCHQVDGWSMQDHGLFFGALAELERTAFSGAGMPGRLQQIRERAVNRLSDQERSELAALVKPATLHQSLPNQVSRPFVQAWTRDAITSALKELSDRGDPERGEALFRDAQCASCHRFSGRGGVMGPDLTSLAARFSESDILASIVTPSDVIAEKYRGTQVVTTDGKIISGQVLAGGDYRSSNLRIATDPLDLSKIVEIPKSEINMHRPSKVSPMPEGLINTLTAVDVADLLAFLTQVH